MPEEPKSFSRLAEELVGDLRGIPNEEPRRSKLRATQPLNTVVEQLLQQHQIGRETPEYTIRENWAAIVGSANAAYSHAGLIERNRLTVLTSHAVVRNELFMNRDVILERLRKLPGCSHIKSLNLRSA